MKLEVKIGFLGGDLPEDVTAELGHIDAEQCKLFRGVQVYGDYSPRSFFIVGDERFQIPKWLKDVPKSYKLLSFEHDGPAQENFGYIVKAQPTADGSLVEMMFRMTSSSEEAFRKGIRMLEPLVDPDVQHVENKLWRALQFMMFWIFMERHNVRKNQLEVLLKRLYRENPEVVNNPLYDKLKKLAHDERLEFFGSLRLVCHPDLKKDPESVAAIFRLFLTLNLLPAPPISVLFAHHPEAIKYVEPQWRDRYRKQVKRGKRFWAKYGELLLGEYAAYDAARCKPGTELSEEEVADVTGASG